MTEAEDSDEQWGTTIQSTSYWEQRYQKDATANTTFEWYCDYEQVGPLLEGIIKVGTKVLEIGCGNSEISLGLYNAGYTVIGSDYATEQINHLHTQYATEIASSTTAHSLEFAAVDCRHLSDNYEADTFEAVVDKACLDSMLSGGDAGKVVAMATCTQVDKVLRGGGSFIVVSHAHPETELGRVLMLDCVLSNVDTLKSRWSVDVHSTEEYESGSEEEDQEEEESDSGGIHVYVFSKVTRARTRSVKRKRVRFKIDDEDFRIRRHFH